MTANYAALLGCAVAGSAGLAYAAAVLALRLLLSPAATRGATATRALVLRALPGAAALLAGLGLALPAFLRYEPRHTAAWPGTTALVLALAGVLLLATALARGLAACWSTWRLVRAWRGTAEPLPIAAPVRAFALEHAFPVVALVGFRRPRLYLARQVVEVLTPDEMQAVLAHEGGHLSARDNLKRLLLRFLPTAGWLALARGLEQRWEAEAEADADRRAGPGAALELASALVKVARLAPAGTRLGQPVAAFHTGEGVAGRVQALLDTGAAGPAVTPRRSAWPGLVLTALAVLLAALLLPAVHGFNEVLVHLP